MNNNSLGGAYTPAAWTHQELYEKRFAGLVNYAALFIGDVTAAEDIVSEVIIKWSKLNLTFESNGSANGYLLTIIKNSCFDHLNKKAKLRKVHEELAAMFPDEEDRDIVAQGVSDALIKALQDSLPHLTDNEREFLRLRYGLNLKPKEIASRLDITPESVYDKGYTIREKLKQLILERFDYFSLIILLLFNNL